MNWLNEDDALFNELNNLPKQGLDPNAKQRIMQHLAGLKGRSDRSHRPIPKWVGSSAAGIAALCLIGFIGLSPAVRAIWHGQTHPATNLHTYDSEYKSLLGFVPSMPSYIPKGFILKDIDVTTEDNVGGTRQAFAVNYENGQESLLVTELTQKGAFATIPDAMDWTPVTINGHSAQATALPVNRYEVKYVMDGITYLVIGTSNIPQTEVTKVISHLDAPAAARPTIVSQTVTGDDKAKKLLSFTPIQLAFIPPGYQVTLALTNVSQHNGVRDEMFAVTYQDEITRKQFSVGQQIGNHPLEPGQSIQIGNQQATLKDYAGTTVIWWYNATQNMTYSLNGEIPVDTLKQMAQSIIQQG